MNPHEHPSFALRTCSRVPVGGHSHSKVFRVLRRLASLPASL